MAEFDPSKIGYALTIDGKYYNALDIEAFSLMMKDPSYCYKFYWLEAIVQLISEDISEVRDVFTEQPIVPKQYDVDHFIPWSFVVNDELWNLMPMDSSLNSSQSNRLPKWNPFFERFARNQFLMYGLIYKSAGIRKLYEACYRDNLHSLWAGQELYRKGNTETEFYNILQKNMQPVYDYARRQGYEVWGRG